MTPQIFDRPLWRRNRQRAVPHDRAVGYLFDAVADMLWDRLEDVRRPFGCIAELGCRSGRLAQRLLARPGTQHVLQIDGAAGFMPAAPADPRLHYIVGDEEWLPLAPASVDLVLANLSLHWVNDLPGALLQIRQALKPDGFFLGVMTGGDTLQALRQSLMQAELEILHGTSPHLSPFATIRDLAGLLQRAGFVLPVTDFETIHVQYRHPLVLLQELRQMGEANALYDRRRIPARRDVIMAACAHYQKIYGDADGHVPAQFDFLFMAGWAPA